ncbi:aminopeptidase P family protein [Nonomuraea sp. KC401]|uniref:M24 family metallopeptidase n=1 Tax=unclassified Nonomuraea TaxID=2593643 RepID=UPI0010FF4D2F|nr:MULTISPECIES: aminopeptidase P family protein [unclassified Nonomuraea]NBE97679.1 M24 family metallopeptidase [Nonomuraea sp. K271]TLF63926.1 aminopeptidase P family protein [Nonomuraea sp. KC401]
MTFDHAARRERLAGLLPAHEVQTLLVTSPENVRYLTGLASSNAAVLVRADGSALLATDNRYIDVARDLDVPAVEASDVAGALAAPGTGIEAASMSVATYRRLGEGLVPLGPVVEVLRTVKDDAELAFLRTACEFTDEAFADVAERIAPGMTERDLARLLENRMTELGADRPAFDTIVAAGENGAIPHHAPTTRELRAGDLVTMDFGARYRGYHADMTRTVSLGPPAGWQRELYDLVAEAQRAGRHAVVPGAPVGDVDAAARSVIAGAGHAEHFRHGLGHGVGLQIHEEPFLGPSRTGRLEDRVPITVEPGVYLPGRGGVRIEDTLVTREGGPELFTRTTKELLVL